MPKNDQNLIILGGFGPKPPKSAYGTKFDPKTVQNSHFGQNSLGNHREIDYFWVVFGQNHRCKSLCVKMTKNSHFSTK